MSIIQVKRQGRISCFNKWEEILGMIFKSIRNNCAAHSVSNDAENLGAGSHHNTTCQWFDNHQSRCNRILRLLCQVYSALQTRQEAWYSTVLVQRLERKGPEMLNFFLLFSYPVNVRNGVLFFLQDSCICIFVVILRLFPTILQ